MEEDKKKPKSIFDLKLTPLEPKKKEKFYESPEINRQQLAPLTYSILQGGGQVRSANRAKKKR